MGIGGEIVELFCEKCNGKEFTYTKTDQYFVIVHCKECGKIIGCLEDFDFNKKHNKIISNHEFFEKRINELEAKLNEQIKMNKQMFGMIEFISNKVAKIK